MVSFPGNVFNYSSRWIQNKDLFYKFEQMCTWNYSEENHFYNREMDVNLYMVVQVYKLHSFSGLNPSKMYNNDHPTPLIWTLVIFI